MHNLPILLPACDADSKHQIFGFLGDTVYLARPLALPTNRRGAFEKDKSSVTGSNFGVRF